MNEIRLSVEDQNVETVLLLLNNLKDGLITTIDTELKTKPKTAYQPRHNKVILEENASTSNLVGKYLNPSAYKKRLQSNKK